MKDRRWAVLAVVATAQLMVVLDATVVTVALPSAQQSLGFSNDQRQWIVTAYTLAFGSILLLGGKFADRLGRRRMLVTGLCGFAVASAVGGAAPSFLVLAAARAVQGGFAGILAPSVLSIVTTTFTEPADRNKAFGIFGAVLGSGASIGLLLGGALTELVDWRAVMYVNVVIAVAVVVGAMTLLRNEVPKERPGLDLPGTVAETAGLFALVFGFSHAETTSWSDPLTIASLLVGVLLLAAFWRIEAHASRPLLPLRVLADRDRGASYLSTGIGAAAMFGVFLLLTFHLQQIEGYSPIRTGVAFLPMTVMVVVSATVSSTKLRPRFGPRPVVVTGMVLGAAAMAYLTRLQVDSSYATAILPSLLALGVGLGMLFSTATNIGTLGVEPRDAGVASATVNASNQVGGSLGTALLSTVASTAAVQHLVGSAATPAAIAAATVQGYTTAFLWSAAIFVLGAVVAAALFRPGVRQPVRVPAVAV